MKTCTETTIIGRLTTDATNIRGQEEEPLYKTQLAETLEGLGENEQSTFWYTVFVSSEKLAGVLIKGTAVKITGLLIPNIYEGKLSYTIRRAQITLLEPPL